MNRRGRTKLQLVVGAVGLAIEIGTLIVAETASALAEEANRRLWGEARRRSV